MESLNTNYTNMSEGLKKKKQSAKHMMNSVKESLEPVPKHKKAISELNFYPPHTRKARHFENGNAFHRNQRTNPLSGIDNNSERADPVNQNLIPSLMAIDNFEATQNFNLNNLNDKKRFSRLKNNYLAIVSPKSELARGMFKTSQHQGRKNIDMHYSPMISVNGDFIKDNVSSPDLLSRKMKGNTSQNNVFYQNSSKNLTSNNISEHNKSSILSFKHNFADTNNLSVKTKNEDSMKLLQGLGYV